MNLYALPLPAGAAARVVWGAPSTVAVRIIASTSATPPADPLTLAAHERTLVEPGTLALPSAPLTRLMAEDGLTYMQVMDVHPTLGTSVVYYHLFGDGVLTVTVSVDAREPYVQAEVDATRDMLRDRIEYHLRRMVRDNLVKPRAGYIPVLEQESMARDDPMPAVLLKETMTPSGEEGIGKHTGETETEVHRAYRYRARVDLLILSDNPAERTRLANRLHEALLMDMPMLEGAGWRGLAVQRSMRSGTTPEGMLIFAEEVTMDGIVEFLTRETKRYTVPAEMETYLTPL